MPPDPRSSAPMASPLFEKLNLGEHRTIHVLDAPESFEAQLLALEGVQVRRRVAGPVGFALAFVRTLAEVDAAVDRLAPAAQGDATLWMVYPKASSRRYRCEFNRDTGWQRLGEAGFEPVRQVAVDEDWSALRFRRVEFIRTLARKPEGAISTAGRARATGERAAEGSPPRPKGRSAPSRPRGPDRPPGSRT